MAVFSRNVVDRNGVPVPGVAVTVRMASGINAGQLAELTDAAGLSLEQPLTTDALGVYTFDAADGLYDIEFRHGGIVVAVDYGVAVGNAAGGGGGPIDEATIIDALGYIPADVDDLAAGLAVKANATALAATNTAVAGKASTTDLAEGLATKASTADVAGKAEDTLTNVATSDTQPSETRGALTSSPTSPVILDGGVGQRRVVHHKTVNLGGNLAPTQGGVVAGSGVTAIVNDPSINLVPEARSDLLVWEYPPGLAPNGQPYGPDNLNTWNVTNPNATCTQARTIIRGTGKNAGGPDISFFSHSGYCGATPSARQIGSLYANEWDFGANQSDPAVYPTLINVRFGTATVSMGDAKGVGIDAHMVSASGPQYPIASGNGGTKTGWLLTTGFHSDPLKGMPITPNGKIIEAAGSWAAAYFADLQTVELDRVIKTKTYDMLRNILLMNAPGHALILGSNTQANNPRIDLRTIAGGDAAVRFTADAGNATVGSGNLTIAAANTILTGVVAPLVDNSKTLGLASARWSTGYFATAPIVGSDRRIKRDIATLDRDAWVRFLRALPARSFTMADIKQDEVWEDRTERRQVMEDVEVEHFEPETVDGVTVMRRVVRTEQRGVTESVPVQEADGSPVMDTVADPNWVDPGWDELNPDVRAYMTRVPMIAVTRMMQVPVYEDRAEPVLVRPANSVSHNRRHLGFISQEVKAALVSSGLDDDPDLSRSVWACFVYDPDADLYMLRYEQFLAPLLAGWQDLDARLAALEAAA